VNMSGPVSPRPNLNHPNYDEPRETLAGFTAYRARLGHQLRSERIGLSQWRLPAGQAAYPYHFHLAEEELLIVLQGSPVLRTPGGWRRLAEGEVVRFAAGEEGAHQLVNDTDSDVAFLAISTHGQPDVVIYPDEGKLCAAERTPDGSGLKTYFMMDSNVPYDDNIRPPEVPDVGAA
jgi:uncharacterized cupin superfamily protein